MKREGRTSQCRTMLRVSISHPPSKKCFTFGALPDFALDMKLFPYMIRKDDVQFFWSGRKCIHQTLLRMFNVVSTKNHHVAGKVCTYSGQRFWNTLARIMSGLRYSKSLLPSPLWRVSSTAEEGASTIPRHDGCTRCEDSQSYSNLWFSS